MCVDHRFDYQLDRHCSKTREVLAGRLTKFDYQLDRHCSKTGAYRRAGGERFDYQLDRHCSKTMLRDVAVAVGLITS